MAWILPSWRFAWRTLSARPARSLLLAISIALAASLVTAVSTGLQTAQSNLEHRMVKLLGAVDVRLVQQAGAPFDADIVERVRTWPGVQAAQARQEAHGGHVGQQLQRLRLVDRGRPLVVSRLAAPAAVARLSALCAHAHLRGGRQHAHRAPHLA